MEGIAGETEVFHLCRSLDAIALEAGVDLAGNPETNGCGGVGDQLDSEATGQSASALGLAKQVYL
jgi:hypothetical protein